MKCSQIRDAILACRMTKKPLLIWGHTGMSKATLVEQVAKENNWGYIQFMLSQVESSGLPQEKLPRYGEGILFLDEINRASHGALQAVFRLIEPEEHTTETYVLPPGWSVVAAANYENDSYMTSRFSDPIFLSRFRHITMDSKE